MCMSELCSELSFKWLPQNDQGDPLISSESDSIPFTFLRVHHHSLTMWIRKLATLRFGFNKTLQTIFQTFLSQQKLQNCICQEQFFLNFLILGVFQRKFIHMVLIHLLLIHQDGILWKLVDNQEAICMFFVFCFFFFNLNQEVGFCLG